MKHVHFIGAGGTGASSVARIAMARGYFTTGCDASIEGKYIDSLRNHGMRIYQGHHVSHLDGVDIVAASPAAINASPSHPEVEEARRSGRLLSWQEFLGKELMQGAFPIAVAGTHGKTTTTAMLGLVLEAAGLDPTVVVGGRVAEWGENARIGQSSYFVCEADEFNNNFMNYRPRIAILNNVDYEHPEFFPTSDAYYSAFQNFISTMQDGSTLIANLDDDGVVKTLQKSEAFLKLHGVRTIGYGLKQRADVEVSGMLMASISQLDDAGILFDTTGILNAPKIRLGVYGRHNVSNALGVLAVASSLGVDTAVSRRVLEKFTGVERRLQLIYKGEDVRIYDDYGHHPTEIGSTLKAVKEHFPEQRIIAILEPHMVSRIRAFAPQYAEALQIAERVYITKLFFGREAGMQAPNLQAIVREIGENKAELSTDFDHTVRSVAERGVDNSVVVVFGAGNSPELTRKLVATFKDSSRPSPIAAHIKADRSPS